MSDTLTPQQVVAAPQAQPGDRPLALEQIQGDILIGLQKFFERFLFFTIDDVPGFKTLLRDQVAPLITTSEVVQLREFQLRDHKNQRNRDLLPLVGINVGFTGLGIDKLVPGADLGDPSFAKGASARAADPTPVPTPGGPPINPVNDPVDAAGKLTTWRSEFRDSFIVACFSLPEAPKRLLRSKYRISSTFWEIPLPLSWTRAAPRDRNWSGATSILAGSMECPNPVSRD